ncbi:hypothetical protein BDV32DRAFT_125206 [Aspergillus pseudonomiae]|uniref:Uncharacterized protein n=1 Tax=Aspergillus pseudonomiae TaxID=1506151 RepID=A0A5N6HYG6_9EURO|nr:uncharacterized protein BDV37DRAFT_144671 [Aspergillus pseudonomiae]KAB8258767.1 hypothetical protein BDV32DRAFT_125206 [Aspergillus pseudonomiae]KAE8403399.1 hypothetical protein BDV37DRAFT_144671 [Aspergillus pseudonomiae]
MNGMCAILACDWRMMNSRENCFPYADPRMAHLAQGTMSRAVLRADIVYACPVVSFSCLWFRWFCFFFYFLFFFCLPTSKGDIPVGLIQGQECALLFCIHGLLVMVKTAVLYQ